jgi:hypothetical protein
MKKKREKVHDFHFIMDREMKEELVNLDMFYHSKNFSGLVVKILELLLPRIEGEHFFGKERGSRYRLVNEDMDVKREGVHIYLPVKLYRRFKLMHQDLNVYSMAQLMRDFLWLFLWLARMYGKNLMRGLQKLLAKWKKKNETKFLSLKDKRQFIYLIPKKIIPILSKTLDSLAFVM